MMLHGFAPRYYSIIPLDRWNPWHLTDHLTNELDGKGALRQLTLVRFLCENWTWKSLKKYILYSTARLEAHPDLGRLAL